MTALEHSALAERLPGASRGAVTDLILLKAGARSLIRLSCAAKEVEGLIAGCENLGLAAARTETALASTTTAANGFVLASAPCSDNQEGARLFVFAGGDPLAVAEAARSAFDDHRSGALLGYPGCCVDAFLQHRSHYLKRCDPVFAATSGGPWPFWSNTLMDMFGWHLLPHFPCSAGCRPSRAMALNAWTALGQADPVHAAHTLLHLRQVVWADQDGTVVGASPSAASPAPHLPQQSMAFDFTGRA